MKKIFLTIFVLFLCAQMSWCARVLDEKQTAVKEMNESLRLQHETCLKVARNFRYDHQLGNYVKYRCQLFESDRQRLVNSVFPIAANSTKEYRENYPILKSKFVIDINNNEIRTYKTIVTEYCKYNAQKFAKTDPKACSPERIQSLFQTMP